MIPQKVMKLDPIFGMGKCLYAMCTCAVNPVYNVQCMFNSFFTDLSGMCLFPRIAPLFLKIGFSTEKSVDLHQRLRDS